MRVSTSILHDFCTLVGCSNDSKMMYRIPCETNVLKLWLIDGEDPVCIGKKYAETDVYGVHEFHIRDINSNTGPSAVIAEKIQQEEDGLHVDITFDDVELVDLKNIPIYVE